MDGFISRADSLAQQARTRLGYGDVTGAVRLLCEALAEEPDSGYLHSLLALVLIRQRRWTAARYEAQQGLALSPDAPFSHYAMASVYSARGRHKDALSHLEQAAALDAGNEDYHLALGNCLVRLRRPDAALQHFDIALQLSPNSADVLSALGERRLERRELAAAAEFFTQALTEEPQHHDALIGMGYVELLLGNVRAARDHAIWALQQDASHAGALTLLSHIKARENRFIGLWWRFNSWIAGGSQVRMIGLLVGLFVGFQALSIALLYQGHAGASDAVSYLWLVFVVYTWVGPLYFRKQLQKEMDQVSLSRNF